MERYSAGLISQSFWFVEFKKVVRRMNQGESLSRIKAICIEENLFGAVNAYRGKIVIEI